MSPGCHQFRQTVVTNSTFRFYTKFLRKVLVTPEQGKRITLSRQQLLGARGMELRYCRSFYDLPFRARSGLSQVMTSTHELRAIIITSSAVGVAVWSSSYDRDTCVPARRGMRMPLGIPG